MQYKKTKLKNGLQTIIAPLKETKAVTILVMLPVGSRYESKSNNGISHFIEHLMFKGTKKRPTTLDLVKELDQVGASFNAFTGKEYTGYYIKIDAKKLELGLDLLSDMLFNSLLDKDEINREKGVIIEEIKMYEDNPLMYIEDLFEQTLFEGNKLGWEIAGPIKNIEQMTPTQINNFYGKHYQPENMILTLAGNIDNKKAKSLLNKYFGKQVSKFDKKSSKFSPVKLKKQTKPRINFKSQKTEQVQLALGFPSYKYGDSKYYPALVLSTILGGNMSSRLFINIRERQGLAYFVRSSVDVNRDIGSFVIRAGVAKTNVKKTVELINKELDQIKNELVDEYELKKAKDYIRGKMILGLEDSESIAQWCANQELYKGKIMTPEEKLAKIDKVSVKDVQKIANEIFDRQKMSLAYIGPKKVDLGL